MLSRLSSVTQNYNQWVYMLILMKNRLWIHVLVSNPSWCSYQNSQLKVNNHYCQLWQFTKNINNSRHYDNTFLKNSVQSRVDSLTFQIKRPNPSICRKRTLLWIRRYNTLHLTVLKKYCDNYRSSLYRCCTKKVTKNCKIALEQFTVTHAFNIYNDHAITATQSTNTECSTVELIWNNF